MDKVRIKVKDLRKNFGKKEALKGVSMAVYSSEIFGLIGPNGAGKTTLLRIISCIYRPTSGKVTVDGHNVMKEPEMVKSLIGFLTGETNLYHRLTPLETFYYFGSLFNMEKERIESRIEEIVSMFGMEEVLNTPVGHLSTGWKQKVSIGRAIIHSPEILILDEPLTGLDIMARRTVSQFIKKYKEDGRTVIFSTHVMSEAEELCDRIAFINNGEIILTGEKNKIKKENGDKSLEEIFVKILGGAG